MNRTELLEIAKPILFNTEMTRAIQENRKTVTRRNPFKFKMKDGYNPDWSGYSLGEYYTGHIDSGVCLYSRGAHDVWGVRSNVVKPKYKAGDILYVRETWNICNMNYEDNAITFIYKADKSEEESAIRAIVTDKSFEKYERSMAENNPEWRPSIHMPKEAARIFLKVTGVRAERLRDIKLHDIEREGLYCEPPYTKEHFAYQSGMCIQWVKLWNSTIKKQDLALYGWDANPWVWVIEFEKTEATS